MKTFSFLVASKNNSSYIKQCLDSLIAIRQESDEILIADESTDQTKEILKPYFERGLISYIRQDKPGILEARRSLVVSAKKDYVFFVDADDFVKPEEFKKAREIVENTSADLFFHNSDSVDSNGNFRRELVPFSGQLTKPLSLQEVRLVFFQGDTINNLWCKFIRRSALASMDWTSPARIRLGEDRAISLSLAKKDLQCVYLPISTYCYRELPQSASSKPHPGDIDDFLFLLQDSFSYLKETGQTKLLETFSKTMIPYYINNAIVYAYILSKDKRTFQLYREKILASPSLIYSQKNKILHFQGTKEKLEYLSFINDLFYLPKMMKKKR